MNRWKYVVEEVVVDGEIDVGDEDRGLNGVRVYEGLVENMGEGMKKWWV